MLTPVASSAAPFVSSVRVQLLAEACAVPRIHFEDSSQIADLAFELIGRADREHLIAFFVDTNVGLLAVHTVSIGTLTHTVCDMAALFRAAILANAAGIVLAHNHPSGRTELSPADFKCWQQVQAAALLLGLLAHDSIVVCPQPHIYTSARLTSGEPAEARRRRAEVELKLLFGASFETGGETAAVSSPHKASQRRRERP